MSDSAPLYRKSWFLVLMVAALVAAAGILYAGQAPAREAKRAEIGVRQARNQAATFFEALMKQDFDSVKSYVNTPAEGDSWLHDFVSTTSGWQGQSVIRKNGPGAISLETRLADGKITYVTFDQVKDLDSKIGISGGFHKGRYVVSFHITSAGADYGGGEVGLFSDLKSPQDIHVEYLTVKGVTTNFKTGETK